MTKKQRRSKYQKYLDTHPHSTHDEWVEVAKQRRLAVQLGRFLAELRRSGAAGIHGKPRRDRANTNRKAVEQDRRDSQ